MDQSTAEAEDRDPDEGSTGSSHTSSRSSKRHHRRHRSHHRSKPCPACGRMIASRWTRCPYCGELAPFNFGGKAWIVGLALLSIPIILFLIGYIIAVWLT